MGHFKRPVDNFTLGSARPLRRLVLYYIVLGAATVALVHFFPVAARLFSGEKLDALARASQVLQDGLTGAGTPAGADILSRLQYAAITTLVFVGTIALMLPVSWVYMSTGEETGHNQSVVQTLIVLPIVVAGIVLVVRDSLALAFSLAGVVAAVRFRTSLSDTRDKGLLGSNGKKPKFNAIVTITRETISEAPRHVEQVLETRTKRWKLDEVTTHTVKPSELYYLVKAKKSVPRDALVTAIRTTADESVCDAFVEVGDAIAVENGQKRALRKMKEHQA